jgi:hypothetical protein
LLWCFEIFAYEISGHGSNADIEIRKECISNIPLYPPFSPDKHDLVNKCLLLENVTDGTLNKLQSTSRRIKYIQRYDQRAQKEKTAIIGKAFAEIDASAAVGCRSFVLAMKLDNQREDDYTMRG